MDRQFRILTMMKYWSSDLGTVFLGASAIFLTRAVPSASFSEFDPGMMAVTTTCCALGLGLRFISRP